MKNFKIELSKDELESLITHYNFSLNDMGGDSKPFEYELLDKLDQIYNAKVK
jgi:hypothetical protein